MFPMRQPRVCSGTQAIYSKSGMTLCQSAARISCEFLLSLEFQIFRLVSPIVKIFFAKSINYRFMDFHFPSTENKMDSSVPLKIKWNPITLELQCILFPYEKMIMLI